MTTAVAVCEVCGKTIDDCQCPPERPSRSTRGPKTKNRLAALNGQEEEQEVMLQPIDIREFELTLTGTSPLIVHRFSEKAKKSIEDKQQKKATQAKAKRVPRDEYLAAFYMLSGKPDTKSAKYGFPAAAFKHVSVGACRYIDKMTMTVARGAFHVKALRDGLVEITSKKPPRMREDAVRLSGPGSSLDLRYRPEFADWSVTLRIQYNASAITPEQIVNMFSIGGFSIGVAELRPERGGSNGMFAVQTS